MQPDGPNDDQKQTAGLPAQQPAEPGKPSLGQSRRRRFSPRKRLLLLVLALVLIAVGALGSMQLTEPPETESTMSRGEVPPVPAAAKESPCTGGLSEYTNKSLGFGFCYPAAWGSVAATDAKFAAADTGSRWRVSFSAKQQVNLGVVSTDWTTAIPRDGVCVDPAVQSIPAFSPFSTVWTTEGSPAVSGSRGIEVMADEYLIEEYVDELLTNGVCLNGYTVINGTYPHASASYSAEFGGAVTTPDQHIANPNALIPATDRTDFAAFVKSVHKI